MKAQPIEFEQIDEETQFLIDQLYLSTPTTMVLPDGQITEVPDTGSIGLLATGYRGILAWRKKREEVFGSRIYSPALELIKKIKAQKKEDDHEK